VPEPGAVGEVFVGDCSLAGTAVDASVGEVGGPVVDEEPDGGDGAWPPGEPPRCSGGDSGDGEVVAPVTGAVAEGVCVGADEEGAGFGVLVVCGGVGGRCRPEPAVAVPVRARAARDAAARARPQCRTPYDLQRERVRRNPRKGDFRAESPLRGDCG
jgi:hypothetical protein